MPSIRAGKQESSDVTPRPYHHGSLREAMLEAAERILDRDGVNGLTLRAAAREAGASHAAPKNHFGDLTGLLSDLAALGFRRFHRQLLAAGDAAESSHDRLAAIGRAYVEFARASPGLFLLMFRGERLDLDRPGLREAMNDASSVLLGAVGVTRDESDPRHMTLPAAARVAAAWSLVHGFAMLQLDKRLVSIVDRLPEGADATALLDEVLKHNPGA
jgi:AcrR family transcriptional regulator